MNAVDLGRVEWRKSSYSGSQGNCVEIAALTGAVAMRDSKDPQGPALTFAPAEFTAFIRSASRGEFDAR
jgi:hypothetical protein